MSRATEDVIAERRRQVEEEGFNELRDNAYNKDELARAAASYTLASVGLGVSETPSAPPFLAGLWSWPWDWSWWKPKDKRRNYVRAAALLIAAIERLDRLETHICSGCDTPEACREEGCRNL